MSAVRKFIAKIDMRVAVIGGGIAGLTSALALAKQGASVCVYEQAAALTEVGAGLQITPNGARALQALGVWDALVAKSITAQAVVPTDGLTGKHITRFDLSRYDPAYLFVHRADLIAVLAHAAQSAGVTIELGQRLDTPPQADLVIGAEGLRSPTRALLNGSAEPFFTQQVAWRAVILGDHPPQATIWMLPGRHVVTYPLSGGRVNIVAVQERESWAAEGWDHPDDPANLTTAFADAAPALRDILGQIKTLNLWGLFRHPVASCWHANSVALVGDAAHPTLPFLAQGANLAIEDALTLSRYANDLSRYQLLRHSRVTRAIAAANANARNYHLAGVRRRMAHTGLRAIGLLAPDAFLTRMNWLYAHDVTRD